MHQRWLGVVGFAALGLVAGACGTKAPDAASNTSSDALSADEKALLGAWSSSGGLAETIYLGKQHKFFRDQQRIMNGVIASPPGSPLPTETRNTGTWKIDAASRELDLTVGGIVEEFTYEMAQGILNGAFLPGATPSLSVLKLTRKVESAGPGSFNSHIAFPTISYKHQASYCTSTADCATELKDRTWVATIPDACADDPASCTVCVPTIGICEMQAPDPTDDGATQTFEGTLVHTSGIGGENTGTSLQTASDGTIEMRLTAAEQASFVEGQVARATGHFTVVNGVETHGRNVLAVDALLVCPGAACTADADCTGGTCQAGSCSTSIDCQPPVTAGGLCDADARAWAQASCAGVSFTD